MTLSKKKSTKSLSKTKKSTLKPIDNTSDALSTALSLKQKLLAQQGPNRKKRSGDILPLTKQKINTASKNTKKAKPSPIASESEPEDESSSDDNDDQEDEEEQSIMDIMRRQFESQFGKVEGLGTDKKQKKKSIIPKSKRQSQDDDEDNSEDGGSDWDDEIPQHGHYNDSDNDDDGEIFKGFDKEEDDIDGIFNTKKQSKSQQQNSSDEEEEEKPLVVKFSDNTSTKPVQQISKRERKLFLSSKAPVINRSNPEPENENDEEESEDDDDFQTMKDLKNDLELQRLLKESHILHQAASQGHISGYEISSAYNVEGRKGAQVGDFSRNRTSTGGISGAVRLKTLDMRMDAIGLKKMRERPVNMKVLQSQAKQKKIERRKQIDEAREAGIILPTSVLTGSDNSSNKKRKRSDRGLQISLVGKHTKFGHIISKKDISKYTTE